MVLYFFSLDSFIRHREHVNPHDDANNTFGAVDNNLLKVNSLSSFFIMPKHQFQGKWLRHDYGIVEIFEGNATNADDEFTSLLIIFERAISHVTDRVFCKAKIGSIPAPH